VTSVAGPPPEVDAHEAVRLVGDGAVLLDVREADEWQAGHAPDATHIPMSELSRRTAEVPTDRLVVCVCHVGARSAAVAAALANAGWQTANLRGGMNAWEAAGLPVVV
jgi:rhodanese-related sulfurtransferase